GPSAGSIPSGRPRTRGESRGLRAGPAPGVVDTVRARPLAKSAQCGHGAVGRRQCVNGRLRGVSGLNSTPKPGVSGTRIFPSSGTGSPSSIGENIGTTSAAVGCIIRNSLNGLLVRVITKWYEYTEEPCGTTIAPWASASAEILISSVIPPHQPTSGW